MNNDKFVITGGKALTGKIRIDTSKNATLPILASLVMIDGNVKLKECPNFSDVENMKNILTRLGGKVIQKNKSVMVQCSFDNWVVPKDISKLMRSSIVLMGPLLAKFKHAEVVYPGGCNIGLRPIDIHLKGLKQLGVEIREENGIIYCNGEHMKPTTIQLPFASVGATQNLMMSCVLLDGKTVLTNVAKEPEVMDLMNFLNKCGANINYTGDGVIEINGVKSLKGTEYDIISDRIILGTYMLMAAATRGKVTFLHSSPKMIQPLIKKLEKSGCKISINNDKLYLDATENNFSSLEFVETNVYPGYPTDLQSQTLCYSSVLNGTTVFLENIFESRYKFVPDLMKMGADVVIKDRWAIVKGKSICGAEVDASDLRGGAGLVLAGLVAKGTTIINNVYHIDRGYTSMENALSSLGADIKRI